MTAKTGPAPPAGLATLHSPDGLVISALQGEGRTHLEGDLSELLPGQRWFGAKDQTIEGVRLRPLGELEPGAHALAAAEVALPSESQLYLLPLTALWDGAEWAHQAEGLARLQTDGRSGVLVDGALNPGFARALLQAMREDRRVRTRDGALAFDATDALKGMSGLDAPRPLGVEQSNVSIAFGRTVILKLYRRLRPGAQPDVEVARFLTAVGRFAHTPQFLGEVRLVPEEGEPTTLAAAFAFVPNRGDAWGVITAALQEDLREGGAADRPFPASLSVGALLGQRTAEMHKALAAGTDDPDFAVESLDAEHVAGWAREAAAEAESLLDQLETRASSLPPASRALADEVVRGRDKLIARLEAARDMAPSGGRSRIHGDYHLGQVLATAEGDFAIIDFEGEPRRSLAERRQKSSPLRDVAGMLRSFDYAAWSVLNGLPEVGEAGRARANRWRREAGAAFTRSYRQHVAGAPSMPDDPRLAEALTDLFLLQKAVYEVGYELANRPDWIDIPLSGIHDLLAAR